MLNFYPLYALKSWRLKLTNQREPKRDSYSPQSELLTRLVNITVVHVGLHEFPGGWKPSEKQTKTICLGSKMTNTACPCWIMSSRVKTKVFVAVEKSS